MVDEISDKLVFDTEPETTVQHRVSIFVSMKPPDKDGF